MGSNGQPGSVNRDALVFVAPYPPFPLNGGGFIRRHRLLTGLAAEFETTFVTLEADPRTDRPHMPREELQELLPGIEVVTLSRTEPPPDLTGLRGRAGGILSPHSGVLRPFMAPSLVRGVRTAAERARAAIVHFDFHTIGDPGTVPGRINVFSTHNVEYEIRRGNASKVRGRRRIWAELDWRKRRREEVRAWRRMDLCIAVSELDAAPMRAAGARRVEVIPSGTDPAEMMPPPLRREDEPARILFVGTGRYPPYERGLRWFVSEVMPRVRSQIPAVFDVVGVPPVAPMEGPGVTYVGAVPSVAPFYERSHLAVVPMFEGSGTRLKIPEALNFGRPVVSTSLGAQGQPVEAGRHYLRADDAEGFAASIVELARRCENPERDVQPMIEQGREAVAELTWPSIVQRCVRVHREEIDRSADRLTPIGSPVAA